MEMLQTCALPKSDLHPAPKHDCRALPPHNAIPIFLCSSNYRVESGLRVFFDEPTADMTTTPSLSSNDPPQLRQQVLGWLVRRNDAGWTAQDETLFQHWLSADPRHAEMYAQCDSHWAQLDAMPADLVASMRRKLKEDKAPASAARVKHAKPQRVQASRRSFLFWPATSALTMAAIGGVGYMAWQHLQAQPLSVQAYQTERGQQQNIALSDGSHLRMDTATRLEVRMFRQRREVRLLDGQAVFEVQHDGRPFHVLAASHRVTVVGTRFSVRYTPDIPGNDGVQVAVEEGKVRVAALRETEVDGGSYDLLAGQLLTAGQQLQTDGRGGAGEVTSLSASGIAPWRQQRVSFLDVPLSQALAELERYRPTGLVVRDAKVAALRLSGTFDPMMVNALHKALPRVLPVRLEERHGVSEVVSDK